MKSGLEVEVLYAPGEGRKFLGYSMTWHQVPRLRIAPTSLKRLDDNIRDVLKGTRGRSLTTVITELNQRRRAGTVALAT